MHLESTVSAVSAAHGAARASKREESSQRELLREAKFEENIIHGSSKCKLWESRERGENSLKAPKRFSFGVRRMWTSLPSAEIKSSTFNTCSSSHFFLSPIEVFIRQHQTCSRRRVSEYFFYFCFHFTQGHICEWNEEFLCLEHDDGIDLTSAAWGVCAATVLVCLHFKKGFAYRRSPMSIMQWKQTKWEDKSEKFLHFFCAFWNDLNINWSFVMIPFQFCSSTEISY